MLMERKGSLLFLRMGAAHLALLCVCTWLSAL